MEEKEGSCAPPEAEVWLRVRFAVERRVCLSVSPSAERVDYVALTFGVGSSL